MVERLVVIIAAKRFKWRQRKREKKKKIKPDKLLRKSSKIMRSIHKVLTSKRRLESRLKWTQRVFLLGWRGRYWRLSQVRIMKQPKWKGGDEVEKEEKETESKSMTFMLRPGIVVNRSNFSKKPAIVGLTDETLWKKLKLVGSVEQVASHSISTLK